MNKYSLLLFGDPGSNKIIADVLKQLNKKNKSNEIPLNFHWTKSAMEIGTLSFSSVDHIPVLVYPNPLNPERYIVFNGSVPEQRRRRRSTNDVENEPEVPPIGDFAIVKLNDDKPGKVESVLGGFFNEEWELEISPE